MKAEAILKAIFRYALAISIVIGFYWLLVNISGMKVESPMRDTLIMIIGVLVGKFGTIVDYEWGTSNSSHEKNATISKAVENKNTTP